MSTRRRRERKERKSYEWLERAFTLVLTHGDKQKARALVKQAKRHGPPLVQRVHAAFDEVWHLTFEEATPWEVVRDKYLDG